MKKKFVLLGLLCIPLINYAQFNVTGAIGDRYGRTNATPAAQNIKAIAIGNFTTFPRAALHVNTNLLTPPTNPNTMFTPGEVFRTDCPAGSSPYWRMLRGGSEIARFYNLFTDTDLRIETFSKNSRILFRPAQITRMIVTDGYLPSVQQGFVGVGRNFTDPKSLFHLNDDLTAITNPAPTYMQITNSGTATSTGSTISDGLQVGITPDGTAEFRQQEDKDMNFLTFNTPRATIKNNGFVAIGDYSLFTPQSHLHMYGNGNQFMQVTNDATGFMANDGFQIGITPTGVAELRQQENNPLMIYTNNQERIRVTQNAANETRIGISQMPGQSLTGIRAMLHLGGDNPDEGLGFRLWMRTGIYMSQESDNMYIGLRRNDDDLLDAIINWGDNFFNDFGGFGPDKLSFVFTTPQGVGGPSATINGKEMACMTFADGFAKMGLDEPNPVAKLHITTRQSVQPVPGVDPFLSIRLTRWGIQGTANSDFKNTQQGNLLINTHIDNDDIINPMFVGIGPFDDNNQPLRRLDVYDENFQQLRLTNTINNEFTDFHTTPAGNLYIESTNHMVGINFNYFNTLLSPPTQSLDVNGNARIRGLTDGFDVGIVTHEINGTLHTLAFPFDNTQVLLGDGSWGTISGGGVLGNQCGALPTNPLTSDWEIPLFDGVNGYNFVFSGNGQGNAVNNVGIGTDCSPQAKLHVVQASGSTYSVGIGIENQNQAPAFGLWSSISPSNTTFPNVNTNVAGYFSAPG
ncbi:MAG: hypothetical protein HY738_23415, partial [Bacteroidia bacterium]|nr:hypothetical protein [Bacteroidia bacterium]